MSFRRGLINALMAFSYVLFFLLVTGIITADGLNGTEKLSSTSSFHISTHRKLLNHGLETVTENQNEKGKLNTELAVNEPNRIWSDKCSISDVMVSQGATQPLPDGIPTYTVEIMNVGVSGCDISDIHLSCGWFSSARLVNPRVFKRIRFDDCLVNEGKPLANGHTLSFQYANTYQYPLTVTSVSC